MRGGEAKRNETAERDAADDRPVDPAPIERAAHLIHIVIEPSRGVELEVGLPARRRART